MTSLVHGLPPESLISAFPFHIVLAESSLDIVQMGSVIEQLSPDALGHFFGEHFKLLQPQINITHAEIMARTDSFFLLELLSSQMMLKGQMMPIGDTGTIVFLGSPWITDLSQVDLLEIQLTDFAIHDSTVDYLLLLQSKNTALNDTKKLAEKLAEKQQDLRARNRELRQEIEERSRIEAELAAARDQAIEASVIKSQFLANMSHEIRTPMNGIMGMGQLLLGTQLSDEQNEFTRIIYDQAEHLLDLINEILDFSKIEAGKLNLESIDFSLSELVMDISRMLQPVVEATDVDLIVLIESDVPERVCGDSARSRQVINNLVSNAIKFTPEGDVQIHLRVAPEWTNSENQPAGSQQIPIEISVQDTGIGINEEQIDKLFDSFTQADNSTTRKFGGTGLGLTVCKNLVELMEGTINVCSELGLGSTFSVVIPYDLGKSATDVQPIQIAEHRQLLSLPTSFEQTGKPIVLVVEDQKVNQMVIINVLKNLGYSTFLAENGEQAVKIFEAQSTIFEIIIMDWRMPKMDGLEATQLIRQIESGTSSHIPIIGMSANAMKGDRESCLEAGMDDYLSKPVRFDDLKSTLERWLKIEY